jgi:PPOX class probable F420-dependent enzyme
MSVRIPDDEAWEMLAAAHTGIVTTLRSDGSPVSLPVWFAVLDQRIYVRGPSGTKKVARIRRDGRVAFLVEDGERWAELRAVHVTGRARLVDDPDLLARVGEQLDAKYSAFKTARQEMPDSARRHYSVPMDCFEIEPTDKLLTWDNRRLRPPSPDPAAG